MSAIIEGMTNYFNIPKNDFFKHTKAQIVDTPQLG